MAAIDPDKLRYHLEVDDGARAQEAVAPWCRETGVRLCVLFGSRATGRAHAGSDIDLAVWPAGFGRRGSGPSAEERIAWHASLQRRIDDAFGATDLNLVVVTPELDPVLAREIQRDARVLYESEANVWAWERLRLFQLYNDALPFLRRQRESLHDYAEEVRRRGA